MEYAKGFKFRIYPNVEQQKIINQTLGCARFVYNHFLAVRQDSWQEKHESVTYVKSSRMLTELKCHCQPYRSGKILCFIVRRNGY